MPVSIPFPLALPIMLVPYLFPYFFSVTLVPFLFPHLLVNHTCSCPLPSFFNYTCSCPLPSFPFELHLFLSSSLISFSVTLFPVLFPHFLFNYTCSCSLPSFPFQLHLFLSSSLISFSITLVPILGPFFLFPIPKVLSTELKDDRMENSINGSQYRHILR